MPGGSGCPTMWFEGVFGIGAGGGGSIMVKVLGPP